MTAPAGPTRRASLFAGAANGKVYAIGGWNGSSAVNAVEEYDPGTGHWTQLRPMPVPRGEGVTGRPGKVGVGTGPGAFPPAQPARINRKTNMPARKIGIGGGRGDLPGILV